MAKKNRFLVCATTLAIVCGSVLAASPAEAVPQWRLRRWLNRPAIDPTIRDTVRFGQPSYTTPRRSYRQPTYRYDRGRYGAGYRRGYWRRY